MLGEKGTELESLGLNYLVDLSYNLTNWLKYRPLEYCPFKLFNTKRNDIFNKEYYLCNMFCNKKWRLIKELCCPCRAIEENIIKESTVLEYAYNTLTEINRIIISRENSML